MTRIYLITATLTSLFVLVACGGGGVSNLNGYPPSDTLQDTLQSSAATTPLKPLDTQAPDGQGKTIETAGDGSGSGSGANLGGGSGNTGNTGDTVQPVLSGVNPDAGINPVALAVEPDAPVLGGTTDQSEHSLLSANTPPDQPADYQLCVDNPVLAPYFCAIVIQSYCGTPITAFTANLFDPLCEISDDYDAARTEYCTTSSAITNPFDSRCVDGTHGDVAAARQAACAIDPLISSKCGDAYITANKEIITEQDLTGYARWRRVAIAPDAEGGEGEPLNIVAADDLLASVHSGGFGTKDGAHYVDVGTEGFIRGNSADTTVNVGIGDVAGITDAYNENATSLDTLRLSDLSRGFEDDQLTAAARAASGFSVAAGLFNADSSRRFTYAGILSGTGDLGAPITAPTDSNGDTTATWSGLLGISFLTQDFSLTVDYGAQTLISAATLYEDLSIAFELDAKYTDLGIIYGTSKTGSTVAHIDSDDNVQSSEGTVTGLIGNYGAVAAFVSDVRQGAGITSVAGGFVVRPDAPITALPDDDPDAASHADWVATGVAALVPVTSIPNHQFLKATNLGANIAAAGGSPVDTLNLAAAQYDNTALGGDSNDGLAFYRHANRRAQYAGILSTTDLGLPLSSIGRNGIWNGSVAVNRGNSPITRDLQLTVTFVDAGGTLSAFTKLEDGEESLLHLLLSGDFNDSGVIDGTALISEFTGSVQTESDATSAAHSTGALSGLIGEGGAVGVFRADTLADAGNDIRNFAGGFVAAARDTLATCLNAPFDTELGCSDEQKRVACGTDGTGYVAADIGGTKPLCDGLIAKICGGKVGESTGGEALFTDADYCGTAYIGDRNRLCLAQGKAAHETCDMNTALIEACPVENPFVGINTDHCDDVVGIDAGFRTTYCTTIAPLDDNCVDKTHGAVTLAQLAACNTPALLAMTGDNTCGDYITDNTNSCLANLFTPSFLTACDGYTSEATGTQSALVGACANSTDITCLVVANYCDANSRANGCGRGSVVANFCVGDTNSEHLVCAPLGVKRWVARGADIPLSATAGYERREGAVTILGGLTALELGDGATAVTGKTATLTLNDLDEEERDSRVGFALARATAANPDDETDIRQQWYVGMLIGTDVGGPITGTADTTAEWHGKVQVLHNDDLYPPTDFTLNITFPSASASGDDARIRLSGAALIFDGPQLRGNDWLEVEGVIGNAGSTAGQILPTGFGSRVARYPDGGGPGDRFGHFFNKLSTGGFSGTAGANGIVGVFASKTSLYGHYVGGFVVNPDVIAPNRVNYEDWVNSFTNLSDTPRTRNVPENEFLATEDPVNPEAPPERRHIGLVDSSGTPFRGYETLNMSFNNREGRPLGGGAEDGVFWVSGFNTGVEYHYAGITLQADLGAPLEDPPMSESQVAPIVVGWRGLFNLEEDLDDRIDFTLDVDFTNNKVSAFIRDVGRYYYEIDGSFVRESGVITGEFRYEEFNFDEKTGALSRTLTNPNGVLTGLIGAEGALGAFHSHAAGAVGYAGGFVARPGAPEYNNVVDFSDLRRSFFTLDETPDSNNPRNQFLTGSPEGGSPPTPGGFERQLAELNEDSRRLDGTKIGNFFGNDQNTLRISWTNGYIGESLTRHYYASLQVPSIGTSGNNHLGAPLSAAPADGTWNGVFGLSLADSTPNPLRHLQTDFTLEISFDSDSGAGSIEAFIHDLDDNYYLLQGVFDASNVIDGAVNYGTFTDGDRTRPIGGRSKGLLSGLISQQTAIGAFYSLADGEDGYSGGFIARDVLADYDTSSVDYKTWERGDFALRASRPVASPDLNTYLFGTQRTTAKNQFLRSADGTVDTTGLAASSDGTGTPTVITRTLASQSFDGTLIGGDANDGYVLTSGYINGTQYHYAGILNTTDGLTNLDATTDFGTPLTVSPAVPWLGSIGSGTDFVLNITVDSTGRGILSATQGNIVLAGKFNASGLITGTVTDNGNKRTLNGLIGAEGAVGVWIDELGNAAANGFIASPLIGYDPIVKTSDWTRAATPRALPSAENAFVATAPTTGLTDAPNGAGNTPPEHRLTLASARPDGNVLGGAASAAVRWANGYIGNGQYYYATLSANNLGLPLAAPPLTAAWNGIFGAGGRQIDFVLNVNFGAGLQLGTQTVGTIDAFVRDIDDTFYLIAANFNDTGALTQGTVNYGGFANGAANAPIGGRAPNGTLSGLIGANGAIGTFISTATGATGYSGGFVARDGVVNYDDTQVSYANWVRGEKTLQGWRTAATPDATNPRNQFLRDNGTGPATTGLQRSITNRSDPAISRVNLKTAQFGGVAIGKDEDNGFAFYRGFVPGDLTGQYYHVGISNGTDLGAPLGGTLGTETTGQWRGQFTAFRGAGGLTSNDFTLDIDFASRDVAGFTRQKDDTDLFYRLTGEYDAGGVITGAVLLSEFTDNNPATPTGVGNSGVFSGLIGREGAVGVFTSGRTDHFGYAGGFVVAPGVVGADPTFAFWKTDAAGYTETDGAIDTRAGALLNVENAPLSTDRGAHLIDAGTGITVAQLRSAGFVINANNENNAVSKTLKLEDQTGTETASGVAFIDAVDDSMNFLLYAGLLSATGPDDLGNVIAQPLENNAAASASWLGKFALASVGSLIEQDDIALTVNYFSRTVTVPEKEITTPEPSQPGGSFTSNFSLDARYDVRGLLFGRARVSSNFLFETTTDIDATLTGLIGTQGLVSVFKSDVFQTIFNQGDTYYVGGFTARPNTCDLSAPYSEDCDESYEGVPAARNTFCLANGTNEDTGNPLCAMRDQILNDCETRDAPGQHPGCDNLIAFDTSCQENPFNHTGCEYHPTDHRIAYCSDFSPANAANHNPFHAQCMQGDHGDVSVARQVACAASPGVDSECGNESTGYIADYCGSGRGDTNSALCPKAFEVAENRHGVIRNNLKGYARWQELAIVTNPHTGGAGELLDIVEADDLSVATHSGAHYVKAGSAGFVTGESDDNAVNVGIGDTAGITADHFESSVAVGITTLSNLANTEGFNDIRLPFAQRDTSGFSVARGTFNANDSSSSTTFAYAGILSGTSDLGRPIAAPRDSAGETTAAWSGRLGFISLSGTYKTDALTLTVDYGAKTIKNTAQIYSGLGGSSFFPNRAVLIDAQYTDLGIIYGTSKVGASVAAINTDGPTNSSEGTITGLIGNYGAVAAFVSDVREGSASGFAGGYAGGFVVRPDVPIIGRLTGTTNAEYADWHNTTLLTPITVPDNAIFAPVNADNTITPILGNTQFPSNQVLRLDTLDMVDASEVSTATTLDGVSILAAYANTTFNNTYHAYFGTGITPGTDLGRPASGGLGDVTWDGRVAFAYDNEELNPTSAPPFRQSAFRLCINLGMQNFASQSVTGECGPGSASPAAITDAGAAFFRELPLINDDEVLRFAGEWDATTGLIENGAFRYSFSDFILINDTVTGLVGAEGIVGVLTGFSSASGNHIAGGFVARPNPCRLATPYVAGCKETDTGITAARNTFCLANGTNEATGHPLCASRDEIITMCEERDAPGQHPGCDNLITFDTNCTENPFSSAGCEYHPNISKMVFCTNAATTLNPAATSCVQTEHGDVNAARLAACEERARQESVQPSMLCDSNPTLTERCVTAQSPFSLGCASRMDNVEAVNVFCLANGTNQNTGNPLCAMNDAMIAACEARDMAGEHPGCDNLITFGINCTKNPFSSTGCEFHPGISRTVFCSDSSPANAATHDPFNDGCIQDTHGDVAMAKQVACVANPSVDNECGDESAGILASYCSSEPTASADALACPEAYIAANKATVTEDDPSDYDRWRLLAIAPNDEGNEGKPLFIAETDDLSVATHSGAHYAQVGADGFIAGTSSDAANVGLASIDGVTTGTHVEADTVAGTIKLSDFIGNFDPRLPLATQNAGGFSVAEGRFNADDANSFAYAGILSGTADLGDVITATENSAPVPSPTGTWSGLLGLAIAGAYATQDFTLTVDYSAKTIAHAAQTYSGLGDRAVQIDAKYTDFGIIYGTSKIGTTLADITGDTAQSSEGTITGLIGNYGAVATFISDVRSGAELGNFAGGFIARPDVAVIAVPDDNPEAVTYSDWAAWIGPYATANTTTPRNQFLQSANGAIDRTGVAGTIDGTGEPPLFTRNLNDQTFDSVPIGGDINNGYAQFRGFIGGTEFVNGVQQSYAGILNTADLGAPLRLLSGEVRKWNGRIAGLTDFTLKITFDAHGGTLDSFAKLLRDPASNAHYLLTGRFNSAGVITTGTVTLASFADNDRNGVQTGTAAETAVRTGALSGLIGSEGTVAVWVGDSFSGGFVASPTVASRATVQDWLNSFPVAELTNFSSGDANQFLRFVNKNNTPLTASAPNTPNQASTTNLEFSAATYNNLPLIPNSERETSVLGDAGVQFFSGFHKTGIFAGGGNIRSFYATVLGDTDLGNSILAAARGTARWVGSFQYQDATQVHAARDFVLEIDFGARINPITAFVAAGGDNYFNLTGNWDEDRLLITGNVSLGQYEDPATRVATGTPVQGILRGIIGQAGALGVFISGTDVADNGALTGGTGDTGFAGGFVARPNVPIIAVPDDTPNAATYSDWRRSFSFDRPVYETPDTSLAINHFVLSNVPADITAGLTGSKTVELRLDSVNFEGVDLTGDIADSIRIATGTIGGVRTYYAALNDLADLGAVPTYNAGAPLSDTNRPNVLWNGQINIYNGANGETLRRFTLNIDFENTAIEGFIKQPGTDNYFHLVGNYETTGTTAGAITNGTVNWGEFTDLDTRTPSIDSETTEARLPNGVLTGLVGAQGVLGVFISHATDGAGYAGGFVVNDNVEDKVRFFDWVLSFDPALDRDINSTRRNQILGNNRAVSQGNVMNLTFDDVTSIAVPSTSTGAAGVSFASVLDNGTRYFYANPLMATGLDLGAPLDATFRGAAEASWLGQFQSLDGADGALGTNRSFALDINFGTKKLTAFFDDAVSTDSFFYQLAADYNDNGVITGTVNWAEFTHNGQAYSITADPANIRAAILTGLIGQNGAVGVFVSGTTTDEARTITRLANNNFAGGFVAHPDATELPPCIVTCVNYDDWAASFDSLDIAASGNANQLLASSTTQTISSDNLVAAADVDTAPAVTYLAFDTATFDAQSLSNISHIGVAFSSGFYKPAGADADTTRSFYAGILGNVPFGDTQGNLGLHLTGSKTARWLGSFQYQDSTQVQVARDFELEIDFDAQTNPITAFVAAAGDNYFNLTGSWDASGIITGNVGFGQYDPETRVAVETATPVQGILHGLIGTNGAVGAFVSAASVNNNGVLTGGTGDTGFVGGFVAAPTVAYSLWANSFASPLPANPSGVPSGVTTDINSFLSISGTEIDTTGATPHVPQDPQQTSRTIQIQGQTRKDDPMDGYRHFGEQVDSQQQHFAGILPTTNLGLPLVNNTLDGIWPGTMTVSRGINPRGPYKIRLTVAFGEGSKAGTIKTFVPLFDGNYRIRVNGEFDSQGLISGETLIANFTGTDQDTAVPDDSADARDSNYSEGTLSGLIGREGAVGVFRANKVHDGYDRNYAGGFVAAPPIANYDAWVNSFDSPPPTTQNISDGAIFVQPTQNADVTKHNEITDAGSQDNRRGVTRWLNLKGNVSFSQNVPDIGDSGVAMRSTIGTTSSYFAAGIMRDTNLGAPATGPAGTATATWNGRVGLLYGRINMTNHIGVPFKLCINLHDKTFASQGDGGNCNGTNPATTAEDVLPNEARSLDFRGKWNPEGLITDGVVIFSTAASERIEALFNNELTGLVGELGAVGVFRGSQGADDGATHFVGGFAAKP